MSVRMMARMIVTAVQMQRHLQPFSDAKRRTDLIQIVSESYMIMFIESHGANKTELAYYVHEFISFAERSIAVESPENLMHLAEQSP